MTKILYVGDVHAVSSELEECEKLLELVKKTADEHHVDTIVFLGDQTNDFDVCSVRVLDFWQRWFDKLTFGTEYTVVALVGNHDKVGPGDATNRNSMNLIGGLDNVHVVMFPIWVGVGILAIPHYDKKEDFKTAIDSHPGVKTLICHNAFNGTKYDSGKEVDDGIPQSYIPEDCRVVAGHIHKGEVYGNIWFPGSPRWRNMNDVNQDRFLWVVDYDDSGNFVHMESVPTDQVCARIWKFDDTPEKPLTDEDLKPTREQDSVVVYVYGDMERCRTRCMQFASMGFDTRPVPAKASASGVQESMGITQAFDKFVESYQPANGTGKEVLVKLVKERVG